MAQYFPSHLEELRYAFAHTWPPLVAGGGIAAALALFASRTNDSDRRFAARTGALVLVAGLGLGFIAYLVML